MPSRPDAARGLRAKLELSGPPHDSAGAAVAALRSEVGSVRAAVAEIGIGLVQVGADPLRPSYRTNPSARVPRDGGSISRRLALTVPVR
ncbi:glutamate-cysteine ligase family protein [Kribbella sp. NPDC003557]|uniref:glutamate-cysteine ligase family protein n=1 Tax=Kribbella sp. NPDC003557 TaxID=3154449 RepID=UPI0033B05756